jgi:hypothetical protein
LRNKKVGWKKIDLFLILYSIKKGTFMRFPAALLTGFLNQLPVYLVWLAGIVLALVNWRRHPRVSLLLLIAMVLFFLDAAIGPVLNLRLAMLRNRESLVNGPRLVFLIDLARSLIHATSYGLLLGAIFGWRETPAT